MFEKFKVRKHLRDFEKIDVSYETLHYWVEKFGLKYASIIRKRRRAVSPHWYLDEAFVSMGKQKYYLWRAVDDEGEVFDTNVT
jgi:putative transposase